jgi:hypothetical protein
VPGTGFVLPPLEEHILHHSDSEAEIFFACLERRQKTVAAKQVSPEKSPTKPRLNKQATDPPT